MKAFILSAMLLLTNLNTHIKYEDKKVKISSECEYKVIVTDSRGNTLIEDEQTCGKVTIDLTSSPKGIYTVTITTETGDKIEKIIKID